MKILRRGRSGISTPTVVLTLATLVSLALASTAHATVSFTVETTTSRNTSLDQLLPGDLVTFNIRFLASELEGRHDISGLAFALRGYAGSVVEFVEGQAIERFFYEACVGPAPSLPNGGCFGRSWQNVAGPELEETLFDGSASGAPDESAVVLLSAASLTPFTASTTGSNENDPGLDGVPAGGDAQFRVTFRMIGFGESLFRIDAEPPFGAAIGTLDGCCFVVPKEVALRVIPEPSSAMLILLGLLGFAWPHRPNS